MSGNIVVIYAGDLTGVAQAFAEAAGHAAAAVRVARLDDGEAGDTPDELRWRQLEWADGIAFGTPGGGHGPAPVLTRLIERSEPLWSSGRLYDKAVTVFTDEPERMAADSILHPLYDALYRWGAVIVGPRYVDLGGEPPSGGPPLESGSSLPPSRLRAAQYRAHRLARLASVLAEDRFRRARLQL